MPRDLTPREQAKLEDFVRKDLGTPLAPADANKPASSGPRLNSVNAVSSNLREAEEMAADVKKKDRDHSKDLSPLTPAVDDTKDDHKPLITGVKGQPELDVDIYARGDVGKVVDDIKQKRIEDQRRVMADKAGLPYVKILGYPISPEVLSIVPEEVAKRAGIISYLRAGHKVRLGIVNPDSPDTAKALKFLEENLPYEFLVAVISEDSYRYGLKMYDQISHSAAEADQVKITKDDKQEFEQDIKSLVDLRSRIKEVPTTKLIDILLTGAVKVGASDVHIEPNEETVRIRYRLDGVLKTVAELPPGITTAILSRLKFLSKLKLDINRMPQDGRFTITDSPGGKEQQEIDVRVATIPVQFGEAVTMRLLNRQTLDLTIDTLGLTGDGLAAVTEAIRRPQGMILECGPTGSGKTTTLYALLGMLNDPGKKVITLEDPIEYRLPGIMQSQVEPEKGYEFSRGFRSVLRLDPDIIMVGEVRDKETAELATQASLTGHIVLSTLHTNDAPTAIPRLIDLGVRPFLLSHAINVIVAQRLVRKICPACAVEDKPSNEALAEVRKVFTKVPVQHKQMVPADSDWLFIKGKGCELCNNTGFRGRIGIFEVLVPDESLERLALEHAPVTQLKDAAVKAGMMTMEQDGLIKALTGVTTISEVWRVARDI